MQDGFLKIKAYGNFFLIIAQKYCLTKPEFEGGCCAVTELVSRALFMVNWVSYEFFNSCQPGRDAGWQFFQLALRFRFCNCFFHFLMRFLILLFAIGLHLCVDAFLCVVLFQ